MTLAEAKKIVLCLLRPHIVVAEVGKGRFFLGIQRGSSIIQVSDVMYFSSVDEANEFSDKLQEALENEELL